MNAPVSAPAELAWLVAASLLIVASALRAWVVAAGRWQARRDTHRAHDMHNAQDERPDAWPLRLLAAALMLLAVGITLRWWRLGHGPFLAMFEILASSLFSLGTVYLLACRRLPLLRRAAPPVLVVLAVMALWLPLTDPADTFFPPSYDTPLLWVHVLLGKLFLGCALAALGLSVMLLMQGRGRQPAHRAPVAGLDAAAWRLMQVALLFESLMLITGALWAQDAWGRWWAWDPLESWAFVTWLLLVAALHARQRWAVAPRLGAWLVIAVFVLAFLTFFGVPFVSVAPHKGAV